MAATGSRDDEADHWQYELRRALARVVTSGDSLVSVE
jgi:hypothetical protein